MILMAAENYLMAKGLGNLEPEEFNRHVMEYASGKSLAEINEAKKALAKSKINKKANPKVVYEISSDGEELTPVEIIKDGQTDVKMENGSRASGSH